MLPADMPVLLALLIVSTVTSAFVALRYFASSGLFAWITDRVRPGLYEDKAAQIGREIRWSLIATFIYGAPAGMVFWAWNHHGWTQLYADWNAYPLWYLPLSVFVYLFAQDTWFYWTHRAMHVPRLFRLMHAVHHDSRPPTAWTAMSFHPIESLTGAILIPVLVFVVPIHLAMLGWLVHSPLGRWLITASHHERHHEEYQCNFGLYFRFWDRVCGTDRGLSRRIVREAGHERIPA